MSNYRFFLFLIAENTTFEGNTRMMAENRSPSQMLPPPDDSEQQDNTNAFVDVLMGWSPFESDSNESEGQSSAKVEVDTVSVFSPTGMPSYLSLCHMAANFI